MCDETLTVTSKAIFKFKTYSVILQSKHAANKCTNVVATLFLIGIILLLLF
jgi:hypothetical protein